MLHNNPTRQSKIVHRCPVLAWKRAMPLGWREQHSGPGTAQADLTRRLLWPWGDGSALHCPLLGKILYSSCFEQRKEDFTAAWWSLRIRVCYPLDLRISEICVLFGLCAWANLSFYPNCWSCGRSPLVHFQQNSWGFQKLAGALQLGWSLAQQQELLMADWSL